MAERTVRRLLAKHAMAVYTLPVPQERPMLKKITFNADAEVIRKAKERARKKRVPLNVAFRQWLDADAAGDRNPDGYDAIMERLRYTEPGRQFSREEMHEG